jgi:hypothetical protein
MSILWKPKLRINIDPDARKDFTFDFSDFVSESDVSIDTHEIVHGDGVTVDDSTNSDTEVTFWVSGVAEGATETVTVRVTLSTGLVNDYSLTFRGKQQ